MFHTSLGGTLSALLFLCLALFGRAQAEEPVDFRLAQGGRDEIVSVAASFLGTPYRWSGDDSVEGFDSSGFVRKTLQANGHPFPRSIDFQLRSVERIPKDELEPADLVFFANSMGQPMQVGVYTGDGRFIHSSSKAGGVVLSSLEGYFFKERWLTAGRLQNLGVGNEREAIDTVNRHAPPRYITTYSTTVESVGYRGEPDGDKPRVKALFRRPMSYYYTKTTSHKSVFEPEFTAEEVLHQEEVYGAWSLRLGELVSMGRLSVAGLLP